MQGQNLSTEISNLLPIVNSFIPTVNSFYFLGVIKFHQSQEGGGGCFISHKRGGVGAVSSVTRGVGWGLFHQSREGRVSVSSILVGELIVLQYGYSSLPLVSYHT